ncbi:hypothetical protein [Amycolatopsis oliviviridis]|nr:hypothetical protein [Amycolatopsis oliviviridis]
MGELGLILLGTLLRWVYPPAVARRDRTEREVGPAGSVSRT